MSRAGISRRGIAREQVEGPRIQPMAILKGTLSAFIFSLVLFAIVSLLFSYTSLSDAYMPLTAIFAGVFSVAWGGFTAARNASRGALFNGGLVGLLYGLVVLALGAFVLSEPLGTQIFWRMGGAIICGTVGGMLAPRPKIRKRR